MLRRHELSSSYKEAVEVTITLPASTGNIAEILSREVMKENEQNRSMLLKIISSIRILARQGLPLRGDGKEEDGNFMQVLKLKGEDDPLINDWFEKK